MTTFLTGARTALAAVAVALLLYLLMPFVAAGFTLLGYAVDIDMVTDFCGSVADSTNAVVDSIGQHVVENRLLRVAAAMLAVPVAVVALIDAVAEVASRSRWAD